MRDVDYPPSTTYRLAAALKEVEEDLEEAKQRLNELQDDDDAKQQAIAEARQRVGRLSDQSTALEWAIDAWDGEAEVSFTAFTATTRARTLDTINSKTVGNVGPEQTRVWLISAALDRAPWIDPDDDLEDDFRNTGKLPPALQDWLDEQVTDLNDLSAGN